MREEIQHPAALQTTQSRHETLEATCDRLPPAALCTTSGISIKEGSRKLRDIPRGLCLNQALSRGSRSSLGPFVRIISEIKSRVESRRAPIMTRRVRGRLRKLIMPSMIRRRGDITVGHHTCRGCRQRFGRYRRRSRLLNRDRLNCVMVRFARNQGKCGVGC